MGAARYDICIALTSFLLVDKLEAVAVIDYSPLLAIGKNSRDFKVRPHLVPDTQTQKVRITCLLPLSLTQEYQLIDIPGGPLAKAPKIR